jgi:hypothetical protein
MLMSESDVSMPNFFRRHLLPLALILFLAMGMSACVPLCKEWMNTVWIGEGYTLDGSYGSSNDYREPTNTWIDNPKMAEFVANTIKRQSMHFLTYHLGFKCSPKAGGDCPDCQVCTLSSGGVPGYYCKPDGDLFVKAEVGPGTNVRAMTYWRR